MLPRHSIAFPVLLIFLVLGTEAASSASPSWPTLDVTQLAHQRLHSPAEFAVAGNVMEREEAAQLEYQPLTANESNRGITDDIHWIRVRLVNHSKEPRHWVLHHETSYLDHLTVFHRDNGEAWQKTALSDRKPFHERPLNHRTLAFAHSTPPEAHTDLYLRLHFTKADALSLNLSLTKRDRFHEQVKTDNLLQGTYYGLLATLILIALVFAYILRDPVYLHFAVYLTLTAAMWAILNGYAFQYLWPNSLFWQNEGFHIVYLAVIIATLEFSRSFLKTAESLPRVNRFILSAQGLMAVGIGLRFAGFYQPVLILAFLGVGLVVLIPILSVMAYRRGLSYARWFGVAWLIYGLGLILSTLSATSTLFEWGMAPLFYAQVSSVMVALSLVVALGDRMLSWDRDRQIAHQLANQDPLTGLGNRRALEAALDTLQHRSKANGMPAFLIMIDLDHFKAINDSFGHEAGDQVLRDFADMLRNQSRPEDFCIRLGGEEFALLIQTSNTEQAMDVAERIRIEFARQPTYFNDQPIDHTLSAGVTRILSRDSQNANEEMLEEADEALYGAKAAGRNSTFLFQRKSAPKPAQ